MLEIVGIAGLISLFNSPAKLFGLVGLYSYGLYLTHQPYVIWLGLRIREVPIWAFLLICIPTLAVLSAWGMLLEKGTNALVNKLASLKKRGALLGLPVLVFPRGGLDTHIQVRFDFFDDLVAAFVPARIVSTFSSGCGSSKSSN